MLTLIGFLIDFCCFWRFFLCFFLGMGFYPLTDRLISNEDWSCWIDIPLCVAATGIGLCWEIRAQRSRRG